MKALSRLQAFARLQVCAESMNKTAEDWKEAHILFEPTKEQARILNKVLTYTDPWNRKASFNAYYHSWKGWVNHFDEVVDGLKTNKNIKFPERIPAFKAYLKCELTMRDLWDEWDLFGDNSVRAAIRSIIRHSTARFSKL